MFLNCLSPDEAPARPPFFADDPCETGLYRGGTLVQILTVKTQAGFESKGVARSQSSQRDGRLGKHLRYSDGVVRRYRNLCEEDK
jgi:hypothetical protein